MTNTATILVEFPENYQATFTLGYKAMTYNTTNDQLQQFHGTRRGSTSAASLTPCGRSRWPWT